MRTSPGIHKWPLRPDYPALPALTPAVLAAQVMLVPPTAPWAAPTPGALEPIPLLYPFGITEFKYLYDQIVNLYGEMAAMEDQVGVDPTGDTMTGPLIIHLPDSTGVILQVMHDDPPTMNITDAFFSSSGNLVVRGNVGIGPFADDPEHRLLVRETEIQFWCTKDENPKSGGRGFHINKSNDADVGEMPSHVVSFDVNDIPVWEIGVDFETKRPGFEGNSDFVVAYDHTAGIQDDLTLANTGADILRISPASHCEDFGQGPKFNIAYRAGSPRDFPDFLTVSGGLGLGGIKVSINSDATKTAFTASQRATTHNRVSFSLSNANDAAPLWQFGVDLLAVSRSTWDYSFRDQKTTSAKTTRLFIEGTNNLVCKYGFCTVAPQATHHLLFSNAAGAYDTVQSHWCASFEDQGTAAARANRAINIQSILDAATVRNYLWLSGGLGSTATQATPTVTSLGGGSFGIERTDTELSLCYAAAGTNVAVSRALRIASSGNIGAFGVTPVARQTVGAAATDPATTMALANLLRTALINLGWAQAMIETLEETYTVEVARVACQIVVQVKHNGRVIREETLNSGWIYWPEDGSPIGGVLDLLIEKSEEQVIKMEEERRSKENPALRLLRGGGED